jgi:MFS family permease
MSLFIVGLGNTIVNVALPSIGRDLHASVSDLQWTVDAYTLVLVSLLMLSGSPADRLGRRRVFEIGLGLLTLGSLACSLASTLTLLVLFRIAQVAGASMLSPSVMSIIRNTFEDAKEGAQAIGIWGAVIGISMAVGPLAEASSSRLSAGVRSSGWTFPSASPRSASRQPLSRSPECPVPAEATRRPAPRDRGARLARLRDHRETAPGLEFADRRLALCCLRSCCRGARVA